MHTQKNYSINKTRLTDSSAAVYLDSERWDKWVQYFTVLEH